MGNASLIDSDQCRILSYWISKDTPALSGCQAAADVCVTSSSPACITDFEHRGTCHGGHGHGKFILATSNEEKYDSLKGQLEILSHSAFPRGPGPDALRHTTIRRSAVTTTMTVTVTVTCACRFLVVYAHTRTWISRPHQFHVVSLHLAIISWLQAPKQTVRGWSGPPHSLGTQPALQSVETIMSWLQCVSVSALTTSTMSYTPLYEWLQGRINRAKTHAEHKMQQKVHIATWLQVEIGWAAVADSWNYDFKEERWLLMLVWLMFHPNQCHTSSRVFTRKCEWQALHRNNLSQTQVAFRNHKCTNWKEDLHYWEESLHAQQCLQQTCGPRDGGALQIPKIHKSCFIHAHVCGYIYSFSRRCAHKNMCVCTHTYEVWANDHALDWILYLSTYAACTYVENGTWSCFCKTCTSRVRTYMMFRHITTIRKCTNKQISICTNSLNYV